MPAPPQSSIQLWQWPNVLALDAALIAVLWQAALTSAIGLDLSIAAPIVLGLSVWLTYTADRLIDVTNRDPSALLSVRHRFAKRRRIALWRAWTVVFTVNLCIATQLSGSQLKQGSVLLVFCLLYTVLNQKFSRVFFPKELAVALIFTGGIVVFLPETPPITVMALFAYLCFLNCLMIGTKEASVDAQLRVHSIASGLPESSLSPLIWLGAILAFFVGTPLQAALIASFALLGILNTFRQQLAIEVFRVLADGLLLLGPMFVLLGATGWCAA